MSSRPRRYIVRDEQPGDVAAISAVTEAAFATIAHSEHNESRIIVALRDAGALTVSLVAEADGEIVGHVAFSPVLVTGHDVGWFGLGPVSVAPERQRHGVGTSLIRSGLDRLVGAGARGCVVLGDPQYYARFGFRCEDELQYPDAPAHLFQARAFLGSPVRGVVTYHAAFLVE